MLPRYVTSGQFSASVEFLNDLQKCILCVLNAEHILLSNSSYLMMILLMDWVKPELEWSGHHNEFYFSQQYFHFGYLHAGSILSNRHISVF